MRWNVGEVQDIDPDFRCSQYGTRQALEANGVFDHCTNDAGILIRQQQEQDTLGGEILVPASPESIKIARPTGRRELPHTNANPGSTNQAASSRMCEPAGQKTTSRQRHSGLQGRVKTRPAKPSVSSKSTYKGGHHRAAGIVKQNPTTNATPSSSMSRPPDDNVRRFDFAYQHSRLLDDNVTSMRKDREVAPPGKVRNATDDVTSRGGIDERRLEKMREGELDSKQQDMQNQRNQERRKREMERERERERDAASSRG